MNTQNMETIGGRLKALRLKEGLSQEQLADELSFGSKSMVSQYESMQRRYNAMAVHHGGKVGKAGKTLATKSSSKPAKSKAEQSQLMHYWSIPIGLM